MDCLVAHVILQKKEGREPTAKEVEALLRVVTDKVDTKQISDLISKLEGKDLETLISQGVSKIAVSSSAPAPAAAAASNKVEQKKEEEEEEEAEEEDFGLFD